MQAGNHGSGLVVCGADFVSGLVSQALINTALSISDVADSYVSEYMQRLGDTGHRYPSAALLVMQITGVVFQIVCNE